MEHKFIKNRDIVLFSFQPWESEIAFNFKDMAYELARHNRVLFVNRALDRNSIFRNAIFNRSKNGKSGLRAKETNMVSIDDNLWVLHPVSILESINWSPSYQLFNFINKINNKRLAKEIGHSINQLSFSDIIFINDNDFFRGLYQKDLLPSEKHIFYIRDFLTIQPFFKKYGPRSEKLMFGKADIVVANSAYLAEYARQWNPNSFDIGQGCHLESFLAEDLPIPEDIANIPRPIIGYCGAITSMRLDIGVIEHIASSLPNCSIVLVGPTDSFFEKLKLNDYGNLYLLGGKTPEKIPHYVRHFDICINPQAVNQLTIGNYPRKIDEYLAAGKPVVATATDAMKMFSDHTFLCSTKEDYMQKINMILADKNMFSESQKERRRNFALEHTWENCIGLLGDAYYRTEHKNQPIYG
jgi:glycosyltransferase involved in cell wall biosynthesis